MSVETEVDARLDRLTAQMDQVLAELQYQRRQREKWAELAQTLQPVTHQAMAIATREAEELGVTSEQLAEFARTLVRSLPQLQKLMSQLEGINELAATAGELSGPALAKATDVLAQAEAKGYFGFATQGSRIVDRVVSEFSEDDVAALGDNIVTILNTVKEMTQPEVMGLMRRTAVTMQEHEDAGAEPPSLLALVKSMRQPETRRGLARMVSMLRTMGEQTAQEGRR